MGKVGPQGLDGNPQRSQRIFPLGGSVIGKDEGMVCGKSAPVLGSV